MSDRVDIYDTTLRDGSQGQAVSFSVADKLRIAERLDAFGVHYIEGGWPGSNPKDIEFFDEAKRKTFRNARLAAFGATRRKGVTAEADDQVRLLIDAETPVVSSYTTPSIPSTATRTKPSTRWRRSKPRSAAAPTSSCCATPTADPFRVK